MIKLFGSSFLVIVSAFIQAQTMNSFIAKNALSINDDFELTEEIYLKIKDYRVLMVGEMHGTNEPARLVKSLAELIRCKEGEVSIGVEIPDEEISWLAGYFPNLILRFSPFFSRKNVDGRNGKAWHDLVAYCLRTEGVNTFFFDNWIEMSLSLDQRDSAMYLAIKDHATSHGSSKMITLSGSIHNMIIPFRGNPTMGVFLCRDTSSFSMGTVCSIRHEFEHGTMMNNMGDGLKVRTVDYGNRGFSCQYSKYLLFESGQLIGGYNAIFYTNHVTHSPPL